MALLVMGGGKLYVVRAPGSGSTANVGLVAYWSAASGNVTWSAFSVFRSVEGAQVAVWPTVPAVLAPPFAHAAQVKEVSRGKSLFGSVWRQFVHCRCHGMCETAQAKITMQWVGGAVGGTGKHSATPHRDASSTDGGGGRQNTQEAAHVLV